MIKTFYESVYFRMTLQYAEQQGADMIFVLSSSGHAYLLLEPAPQPYDIQLSKQSKAKQNEWANIVAEELKAKGCDLVNDTFIFLTGNLEYNLLRDKITNIEFPVQGMPIGKRMQHFKSQIV